jgi:hypothetical protein
MTWKQYRERRQQTTKALMLLSLSGAVRSGNVERRYAVAGHSLEEGAGAEKAATVHEPQAA